jgi:hypothetical protein
MKLWPTLFLFAFVLVLPSLHAQEPEPIGKALDLGPLAEWFTLDTSAMRWEAAKCYFTLKLQAKKDVDTADVYCQAGFFDKSKHLVFASPVQFAAGIPLKKGESILAHFTYAGLLAEEGVPWETIAIRTAKKPN